MKFYEKLLNLVNALWLNFRSIKWKEKSKELGQWIWANKLKTIAAVISATIGLVVFLFLLCYIGVFGKIPSAEQLRSIRNPVASSIYGMNGELIGNFYVENRSNIDSSEFGEIMKNALVATEDIRFYEHSGIDFKSLGRVVIKTIILQDRSSGGGSTLTQQVAKNIFGRSQHLFLLSGPVNKIREMIIARRMESVYTKDEILLLYLNTVSFGENLYGIEKAAHRFFNKKPSELNVEESAILVGVLKAPSYFNPKNNPERALGRRNVVLSQMYKYGFLDSLNYNTAIAAELKLDYQTSKISPSFAAYYRDYLLNEFNAWAKENPKPDGSLYDAGIDGLKIYTSIHPSIQKSAERAMHSVMPRVQKAFDNAWDVVSAAGGKEEFLKKLMMSHPLGTYLQSRGKSEAEIIEQFNEIRPRKVWTWEGLVEEELTLLDSIIHEITVLHNGMVAMDARNGRLLAFVGGNDYGFSQYDQIGIKRQVGSTFKPIAYLGALERGANPCEFYENQLVTYNNYEGWTPRNADGKYGGSYSMYGALAHSINTVSVQIMLKAGMKTVVNLAKRMGITSEMPAVPSLVLGTADISLMEMVNAYASIANKGVRIRPYSIMRIENEAGEVIYTSKAEIGGEYIAAPENIEKIQRMMRHVVTEGSGASVSYYNIPYNIIGKTGTTQNQSDGWFIASSPEITIGSWVGTMDKRVHFKYLSMGSGGSTALPMVSAVFRDLALWKTPMISNFEWTIPDFSCVPFSELSVEEAAFELRGDSLLIDSLDVRFDTLMLQIEESSSSDTLRLN